MHLRRQILNELNFNFLVKLAPSQIPNAGVGVFALTYIPSGQKIFDGSENKYIQWMELVDMEREVLEHIKKVCHYDEYGFWIDGPLNKIGAAYYVNHSENPNLYHDTAADNYFSLKNINIGEELTCKYLPNEIDWV